MNSTVRLPTTASGFLINLQYQIVLLTGRGIEACWNLQELDRVDKLRKVFYHGGLLLATVPKRRTMVTVREAKTRGDIKEFVLFPWKVYESDPNWVPPIIMDSMRMLDRRRSPFSSSARRLSCSPTRMENAQGVSPLTSITTTTGFTTPRMDFRLL